MTVATAWHAGFAEALAERQDRLDVETVRRAFDFSAHAHRGQKRLSGEDYISHAVAVARILVDLQMDTTTVVAALLHDVVEDADVTVSWKRPASGPRNHASSGTSNPVLGRRAASALTLRSTMLRRMRLPVVRSSRIDDGTRQASSIHW